MAQDNRHVGGVGAAHVAAVAQGADGAAVGAAGSDRAWPRAGMALAQVV